MRFESVCTKCRAPDQTTAVEEEEEEEEGGGRKAVETWKSSLVADGR